MDKICLCRAHGHNKAVVSYPINVDNDLTFLLAHANWVCPDSVTKVHAKEIHVCSKSGGIYH